MSFRLKITVCMIWLLALVFGIGCGLMVSLSFHRSLEQELANARSAFRMTAETLRLINETDSPESLDNITGTLSALRQQNVWSSVRLAVDGVPVYAEGGASERMLALASDTAHCRAVAFEDAYGRYYLQIGGMLSADRETLALDIAYVTSLRSMRRAQNSCRFAGGSSGL